MCVGLTAIGKQWEEPCYPEFGLQLEMSCTTQRILRTVTDHNKPAGTLRKRAATAGI